MYMFFCDWLGKFWHLYYFTLYDANARKINKREMLKNDFMIIVKTKVFMGKWKKKYFNSFFFFPENCVKTFLK